MLLLLTTMSDTSQLRQFLLETKQIFNIQKYPDNNAYMNTSLNESMTVTDKLMLYIFPQTPPTLITMSEIPLEMEKEMHVHTKGSAFLKFNVSSNPLNVFII